MDQEDNETIIGITDPNNPIDLISTDYTSQSIELTSVSQKNTQIQEQQEEEDQGAVIIEEKPKEIPVASIPPKNPILFNVIEQTQLGNLVPQILAIQNEHIDKNEIDNSGYNILHHAVSYNKLSGVIPLVKVLNIDIDILSNTKQTPLMISCNYGYLKIAKFLVDNGADLNVQDSNYFNTLTYAVKGNLDILSIYLVACGCDIHVKDINGCSLAHWAAYNNNVFLLDFFRRLGVPLNDQDNIGYTPFLRAIFNEAYDTVDYLLNNVQSVIPASIQLEKIESKGLQNTIKTFIDQNKVSTINKIKRYIENHAQTFSQIFLLVSASLIYYVFVRQAIYRISDTGFNHYVNGIFNILIFLYVPYVLYFFNKILNASSNISNLYNSRQHQSLDNNHDYSNINKVLKIDQDQGLNQKITFLHKIYEHFQNEEWEKLDNISLDSLCSTCLIIKPERMAHCDKSGVCLNKYEHYFKWLDKCICRSNHKSYFGLLVLQQTILFLFFYIFFVGFLNQYTGYRILGCLEIPYILLTDETQKATYLDIFSYIFAGYLYFQNTIDFLVALYGIFYNMTYYEIFNRTKCWYYFEDSQNGKVVSRNVHLDFQNKPVRYFKNKFFKTFCQNFSEYLSE